MTFVRVLPVLIYKIEEKKMMRGQKLADLRCAVGSDDAELFFMLLIKAL